MKRFLSIIFYIFIPAFLFADNVEFTASAPPRVGVNQNFHLQYTVNKQGNLRMGEMSDFRIIGGPSTGSSTSVNIINNNVTRTTTFTYTYTVQATKTGSLVIPPATIDIGGNTYRSNQINIEVVDQPVSTGGQTGQRRHDPWSSGRQQQTQTSPPEISQEDLFVKIHVDKSTLYRGEHLTATIKLYTKVDIIGFEDFTTPAFNGFWTEDIEMPGRVNLQREIVDGQAYNAAVIKKYILFPRHSGRISIEPCELKCQIRQVIRGGRSMIDQFFGQQQTVTKTIKSPEIFITVNDLPRNHGPHFKGAVGNYRLSTKVSRDTLIVNEAVSIEVKISGNGNLRMIEHPELVFPEEFEVYDPQVTNNFSAQTTGVSGSKTWDFTVIPRYPGVYDLGQITFEFFDTNTKQFKTVLSDRIKIAVRKDEHDDDFGKTVFNYNQRSIDYISDGDIRFIRIGNLNLNAVKAPVIGSWKFRFMYIGSLLIFMSFVITRRQKIKERANVALVKNKRANKVSRKRMKLAKNFMQKDNKAEFYREVINALWGYLSDKLGIEIAELKRDKVIEQLKTKNTEDLIIDKLLNVIDKCECAHFSPSSEETKMETIYAEAIDIIKNLEQKLNK